MSGFGQNPQGASAFTFPSLNQPGATTNAPGFTFGAPKTTATGTPVSTTPAFGANPSLTMKTSIGVTATPTSAALPSLGVPHSTASGTLFGPSWSGLFSPGSNAEATNVTQAAAPPSLVPPAPSLAPPAPSIAPAVPSLAPVATSVAKSSPFTFGTSVASATTQIQAIPAPGIVASSAPTLSVAPTQASVAPAPSLSFSFGTGQPPNTIAAAPAPILGMNLPNFGSTPASKPQTTTSSVAPVASTPASTTLKFSVSAAAPLTAASKTTTITSGLALFATPTTCATPTTSITVPAVSAAPTSTAIAPTSTANASVVTTTVTEEDVMTYSKLQENINKWAMELEKQEKIFLHQATEMNGWDRVIVENSDKLHVLNAKIEKVRKEQRHLDLELDFVLSQQNELDYMLKGLEKEWGSVPPSDPERQHTYKIAESLDYKLKLMSEDLKEVVDHMNAMNYPPNDEFNPVMQIVRILNAHMNVLLLVERKTNLAETKVKEVGKLLELCKRDYDRACHLYFD